eukprot:10720293-Ditylum_brightwellii.AAC.1
MMMPMQMLTLMHLTLLMKKSIPPTMQTWLPPLHPIAPPCTTRTPLVRSPPNTSPNKALEKDNSDLDHRDNVGERILMTTMVLT